MTSSPLRRAYFALVRRILRFWVRSETIRPESFELPASDAAIIYALPRTSASDLAVLAEECAKNGLPSPLDALRLGAFHEPDAVLFLTPSASWFGRRRRSSTPPVLVRLVNALSQGNLENALIVPVSVFWGQSPDRETSAWKLLFADTWAVTGRLRRLLSILMLGRKTRVQFSEPIPLKELIAQNKGNERTLRMVHRILRVHFRNQKAAVIGPDLSHRRTLVRGLLHHPQVRQAIAEETQREGIPLEKAEARALRYGNEIASDYTYSAVRFLETLLSWFWNRIYDGVRVNHVDRLQQSVAGYEVVYVPCHRSHIDYLLLSYLLFHNGLTPPHIAAGINLDMPLIGGMLRRGGAFFMRRSFKDKPLYTAVFNEYLHTLFSRGFPVEYFIEGGRSRTGRMLQPRTGMLAMTLRSYLRSSRLPILFVPVYIGYERVLEGRTYLGELRGASKKKESILDLFKVIGALRQRFGQVWVNFGAPLPLNDFLDQQHPGWRQQPAAEGFRPPWLNETTNRLAERIAQRINQAAAINPVNLVAVVMLSTRRLALDEHALQRTLDIYLELLRAVPYSDRVTLPEGNGAALIEQVGNMGMLAEQNDALGRIFYLDEPNAVLMTYYRNNVMHIFALPALLASFFQVNARIGREQILRFSRALYPYLRAELFIRWEDEELPTVIDQWLAAFVTQGLLKQDEQAYVRPDPSSREFVLLTLLSRVVMQTLQRFYMVTSLLLDHGQRGLDAEQLESLASVMAQRLSVLHGLNAPEFFDKSLFRQFIAGLRQQGVIRPDRNGRLIHQRKLGELTESVAKRVLPAEIRLSIRQIALDRTANRPPHA
ncbi:glycerol-3-phosphate 1-O-acyltransferase PlsB [Stutzerimonas kirkiae]|uniref:glycerol-3-phosphate 1-O-acyltransferase PlsB n=1 Tax=Stutzerimonas kirkiae TaxID=2211392 RepID=UPI001038584D|nr:glycerol-3-phosphate 1-O-acyltransferase PlsB [Stutzerimonas kirkiae]TBV11558.1 glycerol-3-phosphate 1-O-acyltransferase [Stutzerimonas kirkiae]